ncbi:MAG: YciI family protein, partial [Burkholderiales bacterium]
MLWAISRVAAPNFAALRENGLQAHLDYLKSQKGILVLSGATLTDDGKDYVGSLLIVNVNSR